MHDEIIKRRNEKKFIRSKFIHFHPKQEIQRKKKEIEKEACLRN